MSPPKRPVSPTRRLLGYLLLPLMITAVGSPVLVHFLFGEIPQKELFFGWLIILINAYLFAVLTGQAIGKPLQGFFIWGLLVNGLRFGLLLIVLIVMWRSTSINFDVVVTVTLFGYFFCLAGEVLALQQVTLDMD